MIDKEYIYIFSRYYQSSKEREKKQLKEEEKEKIEKRIVRIMSVNRKKR